jgi:CRISPR/Cas system-associated exonuclease Cas4 (RecB family)
MKIKELSSGPAAERGTQIHNRIEHYIRGIDVRLPWDAERPMEGVPPLGSSHPLHGVVNRLKNWPGGDRHVERKLGFDIDWDLHPHDADDTAYMVVLDAVGYANGTVEIAEWKSGKPREEHGEQRLLYGLAGLRTWLPKKVTVTTYYVDMTGPAKRITVTPDNEQELKDMWSNRRETIINDKILAPRPNDKCRWCYLRKSAGGPCPMNF